MNKLNKIGITVISLLAISPIFSGIQPVQADNTKYEQEKSVVLKKLSNRLSKAGYVYKISSFKKDDIHFKNMKLDNKALKVLRKENPSFKVKNVIENVGATASLHINLVSKDNNYKLSVDYLNGLYNEHVNNKNVKPVVKMEMDMINQQNHLKLDKLGFEKLHKTINNIKSESDHKIALDSYQQLKKYAKDKTQNLPSLLLGQGIY
ncbi:hypothetical protein [Apilactobacillus ozensis]|uniref:hypothetical protein n=1 Tax=Apilactobacillus ozensis TaxID=866801 RepID=UPI00200AE9C8|nr:hypothetical protein [Apilactobacillus ozensis]MCK8607196.1 hypothetical protein [Apilactobacillus ozensis]